MNPNERLNKASTSILTKCAKKEFSIQTVTCVPAYSFAVDVGSGVGNHNTLHKQCKCIYGKNHRVYPKEKHAKTYGDLDYPIARFCLGNMAIHNSDYITTENNKQRAQTKTRWTPS